MYDMVGQPWFVVLIEYDEQVAMVCRLNQSVGTRFAWLVALIECDDQSAVIYFLNRV